MNPSPPALAEVQQAMRAGLFGSADDAALDFIAGGAFSAVERLAIHRNTATSVLVNALRLAFPGIHRLVGAEFFEGAARLFILEAPPRSAWLDAYGAEFPGFLARLPQAAAVPYLADVAQLEWAANQVLHAAEAEPLQLATLAKLGGEELELLRFVPHPAARLLECSCPADAIWRAVLEQDDPALAAIDLADGPVRLLVQRAPGEVRTQRLGDGEWRFASALFDGRTLGSALGEAAHDAPHRLLASHLARACYWRFTTMAQPDSASAV